LLLAARLQRTILRKSQDLNSIDMTTATIHQNPITLIVPIIPSKIKDLRTRLRQLKDDLLHKKHLEFERIGTIHFARWVIIDDVDEEGNPDHEKAKLVFTSNFDGSKEDQVRDLCEKAPHILDSIYEFCAGYPVLSERTTERRYSYLLSHNIPASSFYRGSPNRSLKQILGENNLRNFLRQELDSRSWKGISAKQVQKILVDKVRSRPEFEWAREPFEMPRVNWPGLILMVIVLLALSPFILTLILLVQWRYERNDPYFKLTRSELNEKEILKLESYEDLGYQNQFTQLVAMKAGKVRLFTFKLLMLFSRVLIKLKFVEGKLMGIPTIHFARWVLFDDNKRVLFFSNFDGSWQQYLGDFIDKSGWGLTSIFSNTTCFPKTRYLFWGGAYDEEHFLAWSRNTELQTQVWYNAYPELGIKNVNNNSRIRSELFKNLSEKKAADFLKLL